MKSVNIHHYCFVNLMYAGWSACLVFFFFFKAMKDEEEKKKSSLVCDDSLRETLRFILR